MTYVDFTVSVSITDRHSFCNGPQGIIPSGAAELRMRFQKRLERDNFAFETSVPQIFCVLSGIGTDVEHRVHAMCRKHTYQARPVGRLGPKASQLPAHVPNSFANQPLHLDVALADLRANAGICPI